MILKTKKKIYSLFVILIVLVSFQSNNYNYNFEINPGEKEKEESDLSTPKASLTTILRPNSNTQTNTFWYSAYTRVDESTPDTSYAYTNYGATGNNQLLEVGFTNTPSDTISVTKIEFRVYAHQLDAGCVIWMAPRISSLFTEDYNSLNTYDTYEIQAWTGSWTKAQIDAMSFRIRANGVNDGSDMVRVNQIYCIIIYTVLDPPATPSTPTASETTCYDGTSRLSWSYPSGATRMYIYEATSATGTYNYITYKTSPTTYHDISKTSEQTRFYKIRAWNAAGYSGYSGYRTITWDNPPTPTLSKPITETVYTDANFDVERGSVGAYVDSYDWEVSVNSGAYTDTSTSTSTSWSFDPGILDPGPTTFRFRLRVKNTAFTVYSDYGYSNIRTIILLDDPDTPTCDTPQYSSPISISWNPTVIGATETNLQNSTNGVDFDDIPSATSSPTSFDVSEGTYYFRVRATNSGETKYGSYVVVNVNTPSDPGSPTCPSPDFDGNLTINWNAGTGSTSAILQISTDGSNFDDIPGATSSPTTIYDKDEGSYWFRVKSTNAIGISYSSISSEIIVSNPFPVIEFTDGNDFEYGGSTYLNFTITDSTVKPSMLYNLTYSYNSGSNITIRNNYAWTSGNEISYEFSAFNGIGSYNFFVIANDNVDHLNKTSINNFTITVLNENYPYFSNLVYNNFEYNTTGQNFTWINIDNSTDNPYYKIEYSKNGGEVQTPVSSHSWVSGEQNSFDLEFIKYEIGSYNFTITSYDGFTKSNSTSFFVNITNLILPTFIDLTYQDFEYSDTGYNISFKLIDSSLNESENYYKIEYSKNGGETQTAIESEFWDNNSIYILNLDFISEDLGLYEFNITAYDGLSGSNSTIFNVNVTNLIFPEFIEFDYCNVEYNSIGYTISWKNIDFSINGSRYYKVEYAKEGDSFSTLIESEFWNNNTINSFSIDFISSVFGNHTFNITVYDGLGQNNMTSIEIEVVNTISPVITGISSFTGEYGTDIILIWYIYDISSSGQYYTLNRTIDSVETTLLNSTWENQNFGINGRNTFYFSDYAFQNSIILYNFTLYVYDGLGLSTNITFTVNITNSLSPEIEFINNSHTIEINESFELEWIIEDPSFNVSTYDLDYKKNNEAIQNLRNDIEWENGDGFSLQILDFGFTNETYNITFYVIANDNLGLLTNESFLLYVSNGIPIIVCNVSAGEDIEYGISTDFEIIIYDTTINITSIIVSYIYQEEYTEILNSSWDSGEKFTFTNLNLSLGSYDFTINVSDGNEFVNESFTYSIVNTIIPSISLNNYDSTINRNNITNYITTLQYSISDVSQLDGTYSFYYKINGDTTYVISNENFVSNYTFDLILGNLTKENQEIDFTIVAEDGLGLSRIIKFSITIKSVESVIESTETTNIITILAIGITVLIGLVFIFRKLLKN